MTTLDSVNALISKFINRPTVIYKSITDEELKNDEILKLNRLYNTTIKSNICGSKTAQIIVNDNDIQVNQNGITKSITVYPGFNLVNLKIKIISKSACQLWFCDDITEKIITFPQLISNEDDSWIHVPVLSLLDEPHQYNLNYTLVLAVGKKSVPNLTSTDSQVLFINKKNKIGLNELNIKGPLLGFPKRSLLFDIVSYSPLFWFKEKTMGVANRPLADNEYNLINVNKLYDSILTVSNKNQNVNSRRGALNGNYAQVRFLYRKLKKLYAIKTLQDLQVKVNICQLHHALRDKITEEEFTLLSKFVNDYCMNITDNLATSSPNVRLLLKEKTLSDEFKYKSVPELNIPNANTKDAMTLEEYVGIYETIEKELLREWELKQEEKNENKRVYVNEEDTKTKRVKLE